MTKRKITNKIQRLISLALVVVLIVFVFVKLWNNRRY